MFGINFISVFVRNVFGVVVAAPKARRARRTPALRIEGLESRQLLTASPEIAVLHVDSTQVEAGQDDVMLSKLKYGKGKWSPMEGMFFELADGTSDQALESVFIAADLKGRNGRSGKDGVPDTVLAFDGDLTDGWADLEFGRFGSLATKRVTLYVMGNMGENAPAGTTVGLKDPIIVPVNDSVFFDLVGDVNPVHTIKSNQKASVYIVNHLVPPSSYMLAGTTQTAQVIGITASGQNVDMRDLTFGITGAAQSVDRIELREIGSTTPFAVAVRIGTDATRGLSLFRVQSGFIIPENTETTFSVDLKLRNDEDAVSNESLRVEVYGANPYDLNTGLAIPTNNGDGVDTGEVFFGTYTAGPNQFVRSEYHNVSFAKISSVTNANPDADGTNIPTGVRPIGVFKLSAAPNANTQNGLNKVMLKTLSFVVTSSNVLFEGNGFKVYNRNDASWKMNTDVLDLGNGRYRLTITFPGASVIDNLIRSGEEGTFVLEGDVRNSKVNSALQSTLQVTLDTDSIVWSDPDALSTSTFTGLKLSDSQISSTFYQS